MQQLNFKSENYRITSSTFNNRNLCISTNEGVMLKLNYQSIMVKILYLLTKKLKRKLSDHYYYDIIKFLCNFSKWELNVIYKIYLIKI